MWQRLFQKQQQSPSSCRNHLITTKTSLGWETHNTALKLKMRAITLVQKASFIFSFSCFFFSTGPICGFSDHVSHVVKEILIMRLGAGLVFLRPWGFFSWREKWEDGPQQLPRERSKPSQAVNFLCLIYRSVSQRHRMSTSTTAASYLFIFNVIAVSQLKATHASNTADCAITHKFNVQ